MISSWFMPLIIGLAPALVICAEPNHSWDVLMESLQPGKTVVVTRMNSANVEGKLLGIASDSITVRWHKQPQVVAREDVYRVRIANIRRRNTLLAMAIGAGATAAIAAAKVDSYRDAAALAGALLGTGGGAAVGGALPIGPPLYQVPGRPRPVARGPVARDGRAREIP